MKNEIFTPISDVYRDTPWNIRMTMFRFGPMQGIFVLKDIKHAPANLKEVLDHLITYDRKKVFPHRYVITAYFNESRAYYIMSTDNEKEAMDRYKEIIDTLKEGKEVELVDYAGYSHPLRISYRGVQWLW